MERYENQLWYKIVRQFSLLLSLMTVIITALCYYAGIAISKSYHFSTPEVAGLWCIVSGIVVLQVYVKESFDAAWLRIIGSFVGALTSFIFAYFLGYTMLALLLCVFFTVIFTSAFKIKQTFRLASLTAAIVIIIGQLSPSVTPFMNASSRFLESAAGSLIAIAVTAVFYPLRKKFGFLNR